ncbi:MAG: sugar ABC transporter permease [Firmicutes bacterium]|nr:sugar ABC transporter permease [Bacillota bacterium]
MQERSSDKSIAIQFVAPSVVLLALITMFPFVYTIYLSVMNIELTRPYIPRAFVGLRNYIRLLSDPRGLHSFKTTFLYVLLAVGMEAVFGLLIANFLHNHFRDSQVVLALLTVPMLIPKVVVALLWRVMYQPLIGIINYLLSCIGIMGPAWLSDPSLALISIVIADVWEWTPFMVLIVVTALNSLPPDPFEAAALDGAGPWTMFRYVTLPMVAPLLSVAVAFRLIDALRSFDLVFVLTGGGPGTSTETVDIFAYFIGIAESGKISYAAAVSIIMLYATIFLTGRLTRSIEHWRNEPL